MVIGSFIGLIDQPALHAYNYVVKDVTKDA
jgi:hypothetical protein